MQIGSPKAFRGLAIFVMLVMVGLVLKWRGMPDFFGALWWVLVLGGSLYLVWKGLTGRLAKAPGGWGARAGPVLLNNCTVSDKWTSLRVKLPGARAAI